jgi:hypothetical protein
MQGVRQGSGRARRATLVVLAVTGVLAALAPAAAAAPAESARQVKPWPGRTITYVNRAREWDWSVRQAVTAWNRSGIGIRFVRVSSRRAAQVEISSRDFRAAGGNVTIAGQATLGYVGGRRGFVRLASPRSAQWADRLLMARIATHELGHVLGLEHVARGCSIMVPAIGGDRWGDCPRHRASQWRCRLVESSDIRRAARLYRVKPKAPQGREACFRDGPPAPPTELAAELTPVAAVADPPVWTVRGRVGWRNPTSASFGGVRITVRADACPTSPTDAAATLLFEAADNSFLGDLRWSRQRGQPTVTAVTFEALAPGSYCVAAWASDEGGLRYSGRAATARVAVPPSAP